ncbi:MAG: DUF6596 domain-containing protein [Planctomycetota bacterium]
MLSDNETSAGARIEQIVRESYGRMVALLAKQHRDIAAAEDALGDALAKALERWPVQGLPRNPDAWLMTAAKRRLIDGMRRERIHQREIEVRLSEIERNENQAMREPARNFPDERLKLMLVCTHPAIAPAVRTPLILQTVLGVSAERIASVFMMKPATMGARLGRAKSKIRAAKIPFVIPPPGDFPSRIASLLEAVYAAFTIGLDLEGLGEPSGLRNEAVWLASIVVNLLEEAETSEPKINAFSLAESKGLLAMMLFRIARDGSTEAPPPRSYLPLGEQPTDDWDEARILRAERLLSEAATAKRLGAYQLEAAIQSVHCDRRRTGTTDWLAIKHLYQGLMRVNRSASTRIGLAAAQCHCDDPQSALQTLEGVSPSLQECSAPYWAVRAFAHRSLDDRTAASECYGRAIGLTESESVRNWLMRQRREVGG